MNKQEAIKGIQDEKILGLTTHGDECYNDGLNDALVYVEAIDEPEKPVVPQYVADWYEGHKGYFEWSLSHIGLDVMNGVFDNNPEMYDWLNNADNKPFETLVKMKLYTYDVEKEKLYTVELPNPNASGRSKTYLAKNEDDKVELFTWSCYTSEEFADDWKKEENAQLTEEEIKEDFAYLWEANLAKEVKE